MITVNTINDIVINSASRDTTLDDLSAYIKAHLSDYIASNVLWDLTAINFYTITNTATKRFVRRNRSLTEIREGKRSALLLNEEMGPGKIRSLQNIFDESKSAELQIFSDRNKAMAWLSE